MNRYRNNPRAEDALRKILQRDTSAKSESDITRYYTIVEGERRLVFEKTNEIIDGKTFSSNISSLDTSGSVFNGINSFAHCSSCNCDVNLKRTKRYYCSLCGKTVCEAHCIKVNSKKLIFCNNTKCLLVGYFCKVSLFLSKIILFSASLVFGLNSEKFPSQSLEKPESDDINDEENELKDIIRKLNRSNENNEY